MLYNPTTEPVEVELRVRSDKTGGAAAEPFRATVRTDEYQEIVLDNRMADGPPERAVGTEAGYWAVAVARSNGAFVIERVVRAKGQIPPPPPAGAPAMLPAVVDAAGVTFSPGSPVLGREWIVPVAAAEGAGLVAITNLGSAVVNLHVESLVDGQATPLAGYAGVTLEPGLRTTIDLADPALPGTGTPAGARRSLRVRADGPVVVESTLAPTWRGVSDLMGAALRGGLSVPSTDVLALAGPSESEPPDDPAGGPAAGPGSGPPPTTR